jgi:hypothetical protein
MEFASLTQEALDQPWNTALAGLILVTVVAYLNSDHFKVGYFMLFILVLRSGSD